MIVEQTRFSKIFDYIEPIFFFLIAALVIYVRMHYADIAMERDEGEYAYAGAQILRGGFPYIDFYNMKLPGVYYCYALIFALFGKKIMAVRLAVLLMNLTGAFLLVKIGEKWIDKKAGWLAGGFYMLFTLSFHVQGIMSNCEHFVVFFFILSLYFLETQRYFLMGLNAAIAVLMKQQGAILLLFLGIYFIFSLIKTKKASVLKKIGWSILGFLIPLSIFMVSLWQHKAFEAFKFFAMDYAQAYASIRKPFTDYTNLNLLMSEVESFVLDVRTCIVLIFFLKIIPKIDVFKTAINPLFLVLFILISYLSVLPGWYYRAHYYVFMIPSIALLMAYGWSWLWSIVKDTDYKPLYNGALILGLVFCIHSQKVYLFHEKPEDVTKQMYPHLFFNELRTVGLILKKNMKPNDTLGLMGHEPQLAFYADKVSASGYMYSYPLLEKQPYNQRMAAQYKDEIIKNKPKWFVDCMQWYDWGWFDTRPTMEEAYNFIKKNYYVRGALYADRKMEWQIDSVDNKREPIAIIFERRDSGQPAPTPLIL